MSTDPKPPGPAERIGRLADALLGRLSPLLLPLGKALLVVVLGFGGGIVGGQIPGCSIHWPVPPTPVPPGPIPEPPGPAPSPAPIPAPGFRVLMVYESAELSKMPAAQQAVLFTKSVRDYLNAHCVVGPDGKTKEWRLWDFDAATDNETPLWQAAMKRKPDKSKLPWVIISNGTTGYEGALPATVDDALTLLKKYGGQ